MVRIYVPDLPELMPVIDGARKSGNCQIHAPQNGYWRIEADKEISFNRKTLGLGPALWNSALTGGFRGNITEYSRDTLTIVSED